MFGIRIQYADAVVAAVAVSSVVTSICGMVIAANVYDALHGAVATPERVEEAAVAPEAERRYPMAEASIDLALAARFRRCAPGPRRGAGTRHGRDAAGAPAAGARPAVARDARRAGQGTGRAPVLTASLRTPIARPEAFAALPPLDAAPAAAPSPLLVSVSPRPAARPQALVASAATRAPMIVENVEVARAEAPEAVLTPASLSEDPDRARLFRRAAAATPAARASPARSRAVPATPHPPPR
jgi:hypothetical protein